MALRNGIAQCITDGVDGGRTVSYGYDPLRRLIAAKTNGSSGFPQWGLSETYDRYGNRPSQAVTAGSGPSLSLSFGSKNQPTGYTYDASGNMTVEPLSPPNNMTYDGENRMTAFSGNGGGASYSYDGNGLRLVKSVAGGTTTVSIFAGSSVIAEYDNGAAPRAPSREYVKGPSGLLAMISAGATTYYHLDHLSARLTTNASGGIVTQEGHFPFGEQWYQSGPGNKWVFTSYQRDSESGLDYALARYYDSRTGTFCSADPLAGSPGDPQSWNRYPYGRNNPITITDPSGESFGDFVGSLINGIMEGLAFTFGGPAGYAWAKANSYAYDGSDYNPVGGFGGGMPSGTSWNGTPIYMPNSGLAGALGLPTMPGGPIINNISPAGGAPDYGPCLSNVGSFVNAHLQDAQTLAKNLRHGVTTAEVLATAGNETRYGTSTLAGNGNFFGLHGTGPAGTYWTHPVDKKVKPVPTQKFPGPDGFQQSGQVFVNNQVGNMQPGMGADPLGFFTILNNHGYATGNSGYPSFMVNQGKKRGPFILVSACMGGKE